MPNIFKHGPHGLLGYKRHNMLGDNVSAESIQLAGNATTKMSRNIVLLVEDDPDEATFALRSFAQNASANRIVWARDGAEALDRIFGTGNFSGSELESTLRVVLLDLNLPKIDGLEVLRRLRADDRTRRLPVVVLTSSNDELDRIDAYRIGANTYIRKPVNYSKFIEAVHSLGLLLVDP